MLRQRASQPLLTEVVCFRDAARRTLCGWDCFGGNSVIEILAAVANAMSRSSQTAIRSAWTIFSFEPGDLRPPGGSPVRTNGGLDTPSMPSMPTTTAAAATSASSPSAATATATGTGTAATVSTT